MLGLTKREIQRRFDEIVEFAELKDFIDAPVKTYSSGMYMRLGFAVAIHVDPDVLLIDEVLAVGDQAFTVKCLDKFAEFRRRNKTILLVTHSLDLVEKFCDRALWLDKGKTLAEGEPKRVVAAYLIDVEKSEEQQLAKDDATRVAAGHDGATDGEPASQSACRTSSSTSRRHVQGHRRPLGLARARDHRGDARRRRRDTRPRLSVGRSTRSAAQDTRPSADERLRVRLRPVQRRRRLLLRHQHQHRRARASGRSTAMAR